MIVPLKLDCVGLGPNLERKNFEVFSKAVAGTFKIKFSWSLVRRE